MNDKKAGRGVASHLSSLTAALGGEVPGIPTIGLTSRKTKANAPSAPLALAGFSADYQELERQVEELQAREGRPITVQIEDLVDSPYHVGPLIESRVQGLVDNFKENKLNSPVVLRRLPDGSLQVVAGRHRIEAYRRLGRDSIEAVVKDYADDEVVGLVFFDNLFAPVTPDYFKYLGFKQLRDQLNLTHDALANKSGFSKSQVGRYLSFEKLPDEALAIIESNAELFGATLASKLAMLVADFAEHIPRACELIAAGQLEQDQAPEWVRDNVGGRAPVKTAQRHSTERQEIQFDGRKYAVLAVKGKRLAITLQDAEEAQVVEAAVKKVLQDRAASRSKVKNKSR